MLLKVNLINFYDQNSKILEDNIHQFTKYINNRLDIVYNEFIQNIIKS